MYGLGNYIGLKQGLSKGLMLSSAAFVAILVFYVVDTIYRKRIGNMLSGTYWLPCSI
ncbi:MAG: hypothetical protein IPH53_02410 [Flavobacteriales bacterium]|nr:hypothetical protein [Flavobacteriales bacterium]